MIQKILRRIYNTKLNKVLCALRLPFIGITIDMKNGIWVSILRLSNKWDNNWIDRRTGTTILKRTYKIIWWY